MNSSVDNTSVNVRECEKCLKLETAILNKKDFVEKRFMINCLEVLPLLKNIASLYKLILNSIRKFFKGTILFQIKEKVLVIIALKDDLKKLKGKALVDDAVMKHTIDPETLKIDVEPITPKLLNKKTAHLAYIKQTQEEAAVLRDLVEHVKSNYPLDHSLESACRYTKLIQELLTNISKTCPSINNSGGKLVVVTPKNKEKRVRFTEPITSSGNTNTKTASSSNLVSNKHMLSSTGVKPSTSASGSQPSSNTKKDKIQRTPSSTQKNKVEAHPKTVKSSLKIRTMLLNLKELQMCSIPSLMQILNLYVLSVMVACFLIIMICVFLILINAMNASTKSKSVKKSSKRKVWKPTGKVFTYIGYTWSPTDRTFTIVGNACPLTRITTTAEVPLRKPTALESNTPKPVVTLVYSRKPKKSKTNVPVVQIVLWYLDSGCSKHMIGDRSQLTNFVNNFLGTVKFENDHVAKILGYGDYQIRNVTISRVYYMEGLGHKLFSVGQLCDSNLEVAFFQHTCFICNLEGVDLLTGSRGKNLYTLSLRYMMASSPIRLLLKASKTKSWLWHRRLSHLNFGKSKKKPHKPKSEDTNQEKLYLLHMDLCGPMRVASVNGRKYILVIVDDYFRFTWVKCLKSKDEAPDFILKFLKMIQVENLGKLQPKANIGIFIGYAPTKKAFQIYNRRTRQIIETIHVDFDKLTAMASEHSSSGPALHEMTLATISSGLGPNPPPSTPFVPPLRID
ncbi:retrovirus-related pol polyprotein from transposon TNT 1-94 [Tanacetum coccineum]